MVVTDRGFSSYYVVGYGYLTEHVACGYPQEWFSQRHKTTRLLLIFGTQVQAPRSH